MTIARDAISREMAVRVLEQAAMLADPNGVIPEGDPEYSRLMSRYNVLKSAAQAIRSLPSLPSQAEEMKQAMISVVREIHSRYIERSTGPAAQTNAYFASDQIRYARIVEEVIKALQSVEVK